MPKALIVEILADAKQFGRELDKAAGKTRAMGKVAGVAGLAIAGGLALGLEKSVKAAGEMQVSTAKMETAFQSAGVNIGKFKGQIDQAESSGRNLGFTNTDVRDSLGGLVVATHNGTKAVKDLSVAEDLARFKHISLSDATKIMTSAMAGSTRAARQLGLQVQATTSAEDRVRRAFQDHTTEAYRAALATAKFQDHQATAASVVNLVSEKLHGQAQAFANTATGGAAVLHAQMQALEENLGSALLPILTSVAKSLASLTGFFTEHATVAKIVVVVLGTLAATLIAVSVAQKLVTAATVIQTAVTKAWTAAQWLLNAALDANPIGAVVIALAALGAALVIAWQHSQTFRDIVTTVWNDVRNAVGSFVNFFENAGAAFRGVLDRVENAFQTLRDIAKAVWGAVSDFVGAAKDAILADVGPIISAVKSLIGWLKDLSNWAHDAIDSLGHVLNLNGGTKTNKGVPPVAPPGTPGFASGGIVTRPTLAMVGEAGPEAIIPLSSGIGGAVVNVTVNGWVGNDQDIAYKIRDELVRIGRREHGALAGFA